MVRCIQVALAAAFVMIFGTAAAASAQGCASTCLKAGNYDNVITSDLMPRTFKIHVPASYDASHPVPLLIDLHGFGSYAEQERQYSGQLQQSDKRGFIAVWPQGLALSWNAYGCCSTSHATEVRDVAFIRAIIDFVKQRAAIDGARVYVTGISNGGGLTQRLACEAADVVHAVAAVSFPLNRDSCTPSRPITVYEIAGTADTTIPYDGENPTAPVKDVVGVPIRVQSAPASLAAWKTIDHCSDSVSHQQPQDKLIEDSYQQCGAGVRVGLLTVVGGSHILYNGFKGIGGDGNNAPIDISEYIWDTVFKD